MIQKFVKTLPVLVAFADLNLAKKRAVRAHALVLRKSELRQSFNLLISFTTAAMRSNVISAILTCLFWTQIKSQEEPNDA